MRTKNTDLKDVWRTPDTILEMIGDIDLDPCAGDRYIVEIDGEFLTQPATDIATENLTDKGTKEDWYGRVFVNPPFSAKSKFLRHAVTQYQEGNTEYIIFLTPDSTDTKSWWHEYIAEYTDYIWFSRGRINYKSPIGHDPHPEKEAETKNVTFGTALSIFGTPPNEILYRMNGAGQLVKTIHEVQ